MPYAPGDKSKESPPATVEVAGGGFAVRNSGGHGFPVPQDSTPSAAQAIWSFFTKTPLAPLPE